MVGGIAALVAALVFRRNCGAEISLLGMMGLIQSVPTDPPISAGDWFALLQDHSLLGLIMLDLLDLVNYLLVGLIYLALYGALRRTSRGWMVIATALGLVGMGVNFATNQAFSMLVLSNHHAAATTEAQRTIFLAAGEALLAVSNSGSIFQGTGYYLSLMLVLVSGLIISVVMLKSETFGRGIAYLGIAAHVLGLGYFVAMGLAPAYRAIPPSLSAPLLLVWHILVGLRLLRLGSSVSRQEAQQAASW